MKLLSTNSMDGTPVTAGIELVVRPIRDEELPRFRELMASKHYLKGDHSAGDTLRYVAELDGRWVALLLWCAAAYKLKHREAWIGWNTGLREARRKLVVGNRRFCLLTEQGAMPNLASRVLGACLRRLPEDWLGHFGYKPLVAETYVDPNQFQATCYKATNWEPLGLTAGSGRHARDFYERHDVPKTLWAKELVTGARRPSQPACLPVVCAAIGTSKTAATGCAMCSGVRTDI